MAAIDNIPRVCEAIDLIAQGQTDTMACREAGISVQTLRRYCNSNSVLRDLYDEAFDLGGDALADTLLDPVEAHGTRDVPMLSLLSNNTKFLLQKRHSKKFGDKVEITKNVRVDVMVISAIEQGRQRVLESKVIEGEYEEVGDDGET